MSIKNKYLITFKAQTKERDARGNLEMVTSYFTRVMTLKEMENLLNDSANNHVSVYNITPIKYILNKKDQNSPEVNGTTVEKSNFAPPSW